MAPSENEGIHEGLETKFNQNWTERVCRVWVNLDVLGAGRPLPVYPDEQTFRLFVGMSQTCQTRTSSLYSITSSAARSSPGGTVTPSTFAVLRFAQRRPHRDDTDSGQFIDGRLYLDKEELLAELSLPPAMTTVSNLVGTASSDDSSPRRMRSM